MIDQTVSGKQMRLRWLTWGHFLNDGIANYLPGILPFLVASRHVPLGLAGGFMSALLIGQSLQPVTGWIADRLGGRIFILGGLAVSTLSAAMLGWVHPVWLMLVLLVVTGLGNTAFHPQALTTARQLVGSRPSLDMSIFLVGGELGRGLGPLAAGIVVSRLGLGWLWLLGLPWALSGIGLWRVVPSLSARTRRGERVRWRRHLRPAGALLAFSAVRAATIYEVVTLAPILWREHGGSLVGGATLVTVLIGVGITGNLLGGIVTDRFGRKAVLTVSTVIAALTLGVFMVAQGIWLLPVLAIMGSALFGASAATMMIGQDIFSENPAMGSGVALGLANGLGAIMVLPLTYLAVRWQADGAIGILILLTAGTFPLIWALPLLPGARTVPRAG
ncbi:MAG: MFS transporter [Thermaerobacter sp.]|nr:MFS transporter [Thermaerobacter sp.]